VEQSAPLGYLGVSATSALLVRNTQENHAEIAGRVTAVNRLFGNPAFAISGARSPPPESPML
jgi:hypothetical protein